MRGWSGFDGFLREVANPKRGDAYARMTKVIAEGESPNPVDTEHRAATLEAQTDRRSLKRPSSGVLACGGSKKKTRCRPLRSHRNPNDDASLTSTYNLRLYPS